ncbi:hypothetical protein [Candidatus Uabimicrobium amorphum]|uniref:Uncharacterized protein n=1 Tax=Uabimicrobium amorphum TaxID=2596890 RepID=A0A5S9IIW1_UABAM|nr:hypothetical protein [Candidatus Uabimicrobium amorphum]BBM81870.1 hypothetical protein UABAM_00212 [Candidatus Uabimicrobium amorphum]
MEEKNKEQEEVQDEVKSDSAEEQSAEQVEEQTEQDAQDAQDESEEQKEEESAPTTPYEFGNEQNMIFEEFAMRLGFVGKLAIFTGIVGFIHSSISLYYQNILNGVASFLLMGVLCMYIGVCHLKASRSFLNIVTTEGDDISFAMKAVNNLRLYYRAFYGITVAGIIATAAYTAYVIINHL